MRFTAIIAALVATVVAIPVTEPEPQFDPSALLGKSGGGLPDLSGLLGKLGGGGGGPPDLGALG